MPALRLRAAAAAALAVGLVGCSGGSGAPPSASPSPEQPAASSTPAVAPSAPSSASASASGSPGPTLDTLPAEQCLTGTWQLVRFVGAGNQTYGTGQGGDVTVRFADGGYTLSGAGKKPVTVTLAGSTARLTIDGRSTGTYTLEGSTARFTSGSATGSGTVELGGQERRLTMDEVTSVVGLRGEGQVACTGDAMTITLSTVRLELGRT